MTDSVHFPFLKSSLKQPYFIVGPLQRSRAKTVFSGEAGRLFERRVPGATQQWWGRTENEILALRMIMQRVPVRAEKSVCAREAEGQAAGQKFLLLLFFA